MLISKPERPSFVFGYWRPWNEKTNLIDSYLDYTRDVSLVKYGADTVGGYIRQASDEQLKAINKVGQAIGRGMNVLSNQMADVNENLRFLNRNMDIQIEQQKLSNLLLNNIFELLKVSDSEKERQRCIELGLNFFIKAQSNSEFFSDALDELKKAERFMKQDYFVLHRIGCIYLYVETHINPALALDYFARAAKYSSSECESNVSKLSIEVSSELNRQYADLRSTKDAIKLLAADSLEKAAFCSYVMGDFIGAEKYQNEAIKYHLTPENRFALAKYQIRAKMLESALHNLQKAITESPVLVAAVFKDLDFFSEPMVISFIEKINNELQNRLNEVAEKINSSVDLNVESYLLELKSLIDCTYEAKIEGLTKLENKIGNVMRSIENQKTNFRGKIQSLINEIEGATFITIDKFRREEMILELSKSKSQALPVMQEVYSRIDREMKTDCLRIGSKYAGGIVFYIDKSGSHGLVCSERDVGKAPWGSLNLVNANAKGVGGENGKKNSKIIVENGGVQISEERKKEEKKFLVFFKRTASSSTIVKSQIQTAAHLCLEFSYNGFSDWYLPTIEELQLMNENLAKASLGGFHSSDYWSSCEKSNDEAYSFNRISTMAYPSSKSLRFYVRPVRAF
jgi:hypothetical protein